MPRRCRSTAIYQVAPYIARCLLSVLNQSYPHLEILLINDATPDASMEQVQEILAHHPRAWQVRVIEHAQNRGLSAARNSGIQAATGHYLFFLDGDDYLAPTCLALQAESALAHDAEMVIGDVAIVGDARLFKPWWNFSEVPPLLVGNTSIREHYFGRKLYMMAWNKLVRTEFIRSHALYFEEGLLHEDELWMFQVVLHLQRLSLVNQPTYYYVQRAGSIMISESNLRKKEESKDRIVQRYLELIVAESDPLTRYYVLRESYAILRRNYLAPVGRQRVNALRQQLRSYYTLREVFQPMKEVFHPLRKVCHPLRKVFQPPAWKRIILTLPLVLPYATLSYYYRLIGRLQQAQWLEL
ncbi:MAG: glycosyltransferase family 2 protein [Phocaeicola sp.]